MGRQARRRRERRDVFDGATGAPPLATPWYRVTWKAGLVGAAIVSVLAIAQLARREARSAPPAPKPPEPDATVRIAEQEPNDTVDGAQAIARLPVEIDGALAPGDRDLYRFRIDEPGGHLLTAALDGPPRTRLRVLRADATELAQAVPPARIGALGVVLGTYLLSVEAEDRSTAGRYRLTIGSTPWVKGLDWEPDDDADHAQGLARREPPAHQLSHYQAWGWWSRPDDIDCFELPLVVPAAGAVVRVELAPPPGARPRLWVLDSGDPSAKVRRKLLAEATAPSVGERAVLPALGARAWEPSYVICTRAAAGGNFSERYTLDVRSWTPPGPFEFEPNDTRETASALPRGVELAGFLTAQDVDWFRISAGPPGVVLRATLEPPPGVAAGVALLDERGDELAHAAGAPGRAVTVEHAGAAFVQVRALGGANLEAPYRLVAVARDQAR